MSDPTNTNQVNSEQNTPTPGGETGETKEQPIFTQSAANSLIAESKRKTAEKTEASILKKLGVQDKGQLDSLIQEITALRQEKASQQTDGDKLKAIMGEYEQLKNDYTTNASLLAEFQKKEVLRQYVDEKDVVAFKGYMSIVDELVTDDTDFCGVAKEYFAKNPYKKPEDNSNVAPPLGAHGRADNGKNNGKSTINHTQWLFGKG